MTGNTSGTPSTRSLTTVIPTRLLTYLAFLGLEFTIERAENHGSKFSVEGFVQNGMEQGRQLGGDLGLRAHLHFLKLSKATQSPGARWYSQNFQPLQARPFTACDPATEGEVKCLLAKKIKPVFRTYAKRVLPL
jgi:hypothetical protein